MKRLLLFGAVFIAFSFSGAILAQKKELKLKDLFEKRELYGKGISGFKWAPKSERYFYSVFDPSSNQFMVRYFDLKSEIDSVFFASDDALDETGKSAYSNYYEISPDEKRILFASLLPARSYKPGGVLYIYDLKEKKITARIESGFEQLNAKFSPDGQKLSFVRDNDVYIYDINNNKETRITFDGSAVILNGVFDWAYEEEFSIINGIVWSEDSKHIAFWKSDQSEVPLLQIAGWDSLHFNFTPQRYPKAGDNVSKVSVYLANVETGESKKINIEETEDYYIPRILFSKNNDYIFIQKLNRLQNKLELLRYDFLKNELQTLFVETDARWIDIQDNLMFVDEIGFLWTSDKDGYNHIYLYDLDGNLIKQLTNGKWEVDAVSFCDKENVYYTSNERGYIYMDLYAVNINTCERKLLTETKGTNETIFSACGKFYLHKNSSVNSPPYYGIKSTDGNFKKDIVIPDTSIFNDYNFSKAEFFTFTASDGEILNGLIMKPRDFDLNKKYPVLFDNYSGPGSRYVRDEWRPFYYIWNQLLTQNGYIIVSIDGRGTGGRGAEFKKIVYKNLGTWETGDHIEAAKYLSSLQFVDKKRIGIWGWSYGGYISALTLLKGADYFKIAVSVAPVTDWRFYDAIYTERFMSLPKFNPEGYRASSVLTYADSLRGRLLLCHGTADDNVHFQNTIALIEKLIENNKAFESAIYPGAKHGISKGNSRKHLFKKIHAFIIENL